MSIPSPRIAAFAAAGALALVLSACTPEAEPSPEPTPTASTAPIFASDEEALAAAVEAYEAYAEASAAITAEAGKSPDRIDPFVTEDYAASLHKEYEAFAATGGRLLGTATHDTVSLIERSEAGTEARVSIYLCQDVSEVRAIAADGRDVTPADRPDRVPSQADFVSSGQSNVLLVDGISLWSGDDFC